MLSNVAAAQHALGVSAFSEALFPDDDVCKQLLITFDDNILLGKTTECKSFLGVSAGKWELS